MSEAFVGCGPIPTKRKGYFQDFRALEVSESWQEPVGEQPLSGWRQSAGESFVFILQAWKWLVLDPLDAPGQPPLELAREELGLLRPGAASDAIWQRVLSQAAALQANYVSLKTPASFTPSQRNIDNLRRFAEAHRASEAAFKLAWEPRGLWEVEEIVELCTELQMAAVFDPWTDYEFPDPPPTDAIYVLTQPRGRRNFDRDDLLDLSDFIAEHEHPVTVIFRGSDRDRNARALLRVLEEEGA